MRAAQRYQQQKGDYYAAGITYFSVLALFPLLMVAFAIAGFVLAGQPELLARNCRTSITKNVPGVMGDTLNTLIDPAIASRASVGVLGLLGAAYAGLGWMANLRDALTGDVGAASASRRDSCVTKLGDRGALLGLGSGDGRLARILRAEQRSRGPSVVSRCSTSTTASVDRRRVARICRPGVAVATWAVFAWVIARLPREPVTFRSAPKAALLAAVVFEIFKQVGAIYLNGGHRGSRRASRSARSSVCSCSSTSLPDAALLDGVGRDRSANLAIAYVPPPDPAVIYPADQVHAGPTVRGGLALVGAGAAGGPRACRDCADAADNALECRAWHAAPRFLSGGGAPVARRRSPATGRRPTRRSRHAARRASSWSVSPATGRADRTVAAADQRCGGRPSRGRGGSPVGRMQVLE